MKTTVITEAKVSAAKEQGLEIIGQPTNDKEGNPRYLLYRFNECSHEQNIDTNGVRKGLFKCRQCEQDRLEKQANSSGLILLERAHKGTPGLYEFKECGHTQRIGYDAVTKGLFRCRTCYYDGKQVLDKYKEEAAKQGLEFINTTSVGKALYQNKECSHIFEYQITAIRSLSRGGFLVRCQVCEVSKYDFLQEKLDITFISREKDKQTYSYNKCGHTNTQSLYLLNSGSMVECRECKASFVVEVALAKGYKLTEKKDIYYCVKCSFERKLSNHEIINDGLFCNNCRDIRVFQTANAFGVEYVAEATNGDNRYFHGVFTSCGHTKDFAKGDIIRKGKAKLICATCVQDKHYEEAKSVGLTLIGKASNGNPNYRSFKMPCCGDVQDIELTHVRRNSFLCVNCEETFYDKESNIYILTIRNDTNTWLKMGIAQDINKRITQYGLDKSFSVDKTYVAPFSRGYDAVKIEKQVHSIMKVFRLDPAEMKMFHTKSGWTECYPTNLLEMLIHTTEDLIKNQLP